MLQVSARHASTSAYESSNMQHIHHHHSASLPGLQLPRELTKPPLREVSRDAIIDVEPSLASTPIEYIRNHVRSRADVYQQSIASVTTIPAKLPRSHVPSSFDLPRVVNEPPTCVLAVSGQTSSTGEVYLVPSQHLVLATNCASLPRLPPPRLHFRSNGTVTTPVIPITVPDERAFIAIHSLLVSHRLDRFICQLIPVHPQLITLSSSRAGSSSASPLSHLSVSHIAISLAHNATGDRMNALMGVTKFINGVWRTACALGVHDEEMWAAMRFSWEVTLGALNMVMSGQA